MEEEYVVRVRDGVGPVMTAKVIRASINKVNLKLPNGLIISCYKWNGNPYGGYSSHRVLEDDLEILKSVPVKYRDNKAVKGSIIRKSKGVPGSWDV